MTKLENVNLSFPPQTFRANDLYTYTLGAGEGKKRWHLDPPFINNKFYSLKNVKYTNPSRK